VNWAGGLLHRAVCLVVSALACATAVAQDRPEPPLVVTREIPYRAAEGDELIGARCVVDILHPPAPRAGGVGLPTIIWFHAGGLTTGEKWIPPGFKDKGFIVVAAGYRLSPRVEARVCIEDAAAAVAWCMDNIADYGGDPSRIVVTGHSAGGYLASMVGLDKRWLAAHGKDPDDLAGLAPISGHGITHFRVRAERGIPGTRAVVDELAPLYHVRAEAPPMLMISGDREREMLGRYEESAFFWRMMRVVGHTDVELMELDGYDHGGVVEPAQRLVVEFAERVTRASKSSE
jgi:acetyl esterase/lipase